MGMKWWSRTRRRSLTLKNFATPRVVREVGAMVAAVEGGGWNWFAGNAENLTEKVETEFPEGGNSFWNWI